MAAPQVIGDSWDGVQGPRIKPVPITKTWRNDRDPTRRRATFGVPYPLWEITIEKSADSHAKLPARFEKTKRRSVPGVRFVLLAQNLIFPIRISVNASSTGQNRGASRKLWVQHLRTALSVVVFSEGLVFRHVTFEGCTFYRCDFGGSEFEECQFVDCIFTECTAENASFVATEIDPTAFLRGMPPPVYNYENPIPDGEATAAQVAADWMEVRRKLAAQLLRSNTEIHHTFNSDRGLFELKRAEVKARLQALRAPPSERRWRRLPLRAIQVFLSWLVLHATRGGTSLSRLFLAATFATLLYASCFLSSHVTFMNQDCHLSSFEPSLVLQQLARAASLFLAIGYTAFSGGPLATVLLTVAASLGLFWYALVAEVVIHRVYR